MPGMSYQYDKPVTRTVSGIDVDVRGPRRLAARFSRAAARDLFPTLKQEDQAVWSDFLRRVRKGERVDFVQVQRALSDLRAEMRDMQRGSSPVKGSKEIAEMHDALLRARDRALKEHPQLKAEIDKLEMEYGQAREALDRSMLGSLLNRAPGGGFRVRDEAVLERMLASPTGTREVARAVRDPSYAEHMGGMRAMRQGIFGMYRDKVMVEGKFSPTAHRAFLNKYGESLKEVLGIDEMRRMRAPGGAIKMLEAEKKLESELAAYLNKSIGTKIQEWDAGAVIDSLWNPMNRERIDDVMRRLAPHPELLAEFKGAAAGRVRAALGEYNSDVGGFLPDANKLGKHLYGTDMAPWREAVEQVFGKRYMEGLRGLHQVFKLAQAAGPSTMSDTVVSGLTNPGSLAWTHAARIFFAPLSARGRALTAGLKTSSTMRMRRLDELLADPQAMIDLARLSKINPRSGAYGIVLSDLARRVGYDEAPTTMDEEFGIAP
jgi:hypothetical protein